MKYCASHAATPSESAIERMPTAERQDRRRRRCRRRGAAGAASGAAPGPPRERASAALARRRSKFRGASPVQPSHASGYVGRSSAASAAVVSRRRGSSASTGPLPASRPTMTRKPPSLPTNSGLLVSSEDSVPGDARKVAHGADDRLERLAPSRARRARARPRATRRTRSVNGDRNRRSSSSRTAWRLAATACARRPRAGSRSCARPERRAAGDDGPCGDDRPPVAHDGGAAMRCSAARQAEVGSRTPVVTRSWERAGVP